MDYFVGFHIIAYNNLVWSDAPCTYGVLYVIDLDHLVLDNLDDVKVSKVEKNEGKGKQGVKRQLIDVGMSFYKCTITRQ